MLLCHTAVDLAFITDEDAKMQHIFAYNGLLWGGGATARDLHFYKALFKLM